MKSVFALFSNQSDADKAVSKLKEAGIDTQKASVHSEHTVEDSITVGPLAGPATTAPSTTGAATGTGPHSATGAALTDETVQSYLDRINVPADQQHFFAHGVREGGALVHVKAENDEAETVERALAEAGGRAPQSE